MITIYDTTTDQERALSSVSEVADYIAPLADASAVNIRAHTGTGFLHLELGNPVRRAGTLIECRSHGTIRELFERREEAVRRFLDRLRETTRG